MKTITKNFVLIAALTAVGSLAPACSCGDDDDNGNNNPDSGIDAPDIDADVNAFPSLGTQIDRTGRPAISTALIASVLYADDPSKGALKDAYNADDDPATWVATYQAEIEAHLGVLDSINNDDNNGCGDNLLYDVDNTSYAPLAGALANDVLLIDSSKDVCLQYLAVEATANGIPIPGAADDCGGRTPIMDVVDVSYSVLVNGGAAVVSDGIPPTGTANTTAFPFLGEPIPAN